MSLAFGQQIDCQHTKSQFNCVKLVKNYDADTITFRLPNTTEFFSTMSVRVYGLDTPEIRGKTDCEKELAKSAKEFVKSELEKAKVISLKNVQGDKYFRLLANVEYDGKDLTKELLSRGLAYEYFGDKKQERTWCDEKNRYNATFGDKGNGQAKGKESP